MDALGDRVSGGAHFVARVPADANVRFTSWTLPKKEGLRYVPGFPEAVPKKKSIVNLAWGARGFVVLIDLAWGALRFVLLCNDVFFARRASGRQPPRTSRMGPHEEDTALSRTRRGRFDTKTLLLRSASAPFRAYRRAIGTVFGLLS